MSTQNAERRLSDSEPLLNEAEVARRLHLTVDTLRAWRCRGGGPVYIRCGKAVRYAPSDLRAWLDARRRRSTSEAGGVE